MSGAKKCGPHLRGAPQTHDRQTQARGAAAAARPPQAARFKPPAQANPAARPATNAPVQPKRPPSAPPVYRPQPVPKVLQKKTPPGRPAGNTRAPAHSPAQPLARPAAPPVYRPEPKKVVQPKSSAPATPRPPRAPAGQPRAVPTPPPQAHAQRASVARPKESATLQMKQANAAPPARNAVAPAPRAAAATRPSVLQLMRQDHSEHYKGHWPPPEDPEEEFPPPTPSLYYYKAATEYYMEMDDFDTADKYTDFYEEKSGKTVGQTSGSREDDEYDESYVDIPIGIRPSAPSALWNTVYGGLRDSHKYAGWQWVDCEENCTGRVYVDKKTKKEDGTTKRPPMCHVVAYNHIKWAVSWLYNNKSHHVVGGTYKGPDVSGFPDDTWRELVWHKSNLRPGHSKCNSQTASQAKGNPGQKVANGAISYVVYRLKKLKPHWF